MSGDDGNDRTEGFLGRWSRLKRQGGPEAVPAPERQEAASSPVVETAPPEPIPLPELPSIESITAQTDISAFMNPAVPDDLREAALRRIWSVDPSIRDFVSPAVDYAYDWNAPGGAPGWGALGRADDVVRMLSEAVDGFARSAVADPREDAAPEAPAAAAPLPCDIQPHECVDPLDLPSLATAAPAAAVEAGPVAAGSLRAAVLAAREPEEPVQPFRRHGGALPQ